MRDHTKFRVFKLADEFDLLQSSAFRLYTWVVTNFGKLKGMIT